MNSAETSVLLAVAAMLAAVVFLEGSGGTLGAWLGVFLLPLGMLATAAALLHMLARVTR